MKKILYTICFFVLCVIDQRIKTCTGLDGWLETFRDLTGVVVAVIIISHYRISDWERWKLIYLLWTGFSIIGGTAAFFWGIHNRPFLNDWAVIILDVVLFGYILLHVFLEIVIEKRYPRINKRFAAVWAVMMILMLISRSDYIWPLCYLVMFGCLMLTDFTDREQEDIFHGMLNGIILGFFCLQGLCFVFRPYDRVRYQGIYHNCNLNGLFYLAVLAAALTKLIYTYKRKGAWWLKLYYWLGCGTVISFLFLNIGRSAWITAFILVLVGLWMLGKTKAAGRFWRNAAVMLLCACLTFPLCFGAVRYLPPVFHHPIWFWGEWSESRVHSWDPWDSEKYVDFDEFWDEAMGRIQSSVENVLQHLPFSMISEAAGTEEVELRSGSGEETDEAIDSVFGADDERISDSLMVRGTIYQYYFRHLNLFGHRSDEQGFQLTPTYWIGHAHDIYLQYGTDFGIPVMILFIVLLIWACRIFFKRIRGEALVFGTGYLMFLLIPAVFGLFEYSWGTGSLSISMLFFAWSWAARDDDRIVKE